ncbi:MAG: multidrug MFS transporter [Clostridiales bacterium]|nr:multidrug MFS transporter [Clostridiales bacterium]
MIFVTVGTHEQQFNRLIEYVDHWTQGLEEEVIIQTGVSTYKPQNCTWSQFYKQQEVYDLIEAARIVITHGGASSYMDVLQRGKIPIVVPRLREFKEHVNNHQLEFSRVYKKLYNSIILVENIEQLGDCIENYNEITTELNNSIMSNNAEFCEAFIKIVDDLFK